MTQLEAEVNGGRGSTGPPMIEEREMLFQETTPMCDGCKRILLPGEPQHELIRYRVGLVTYGNCCIDAARQSIEGVRQ